MKVVDRYVELLGSFFQNGPGFFWDVVALVPFPDEVEWTNNCIRDEIDIEGVDDSVFAL